MIKLIDIFAGPGGLGEGFSSWRDARGRQPFSIAASIEKDVNAHATLRLRALKRLLPQGSGKEYSAFLMGELGWDALTQAYPALAQLASVEANLLELGPKTAGIAQEIVAKAVGGSDRWVLVGGPPCQAYSIVGRVRNRGTASYRPSRDKRQTLYVEYLQILADHAPPVFVMENVKGLLSATLNRSSLFERILEDLREPAKALRREGRSTGDRAPRYELHALTPQTDLFGTDPRDFVVRAEEFGVPQRRHRVILLGIRADAAPGQRPSLSPSGLLSTVGNSLKGLPRLRSGLSGEPDSSIAWLRAIRSVKRAQWFAKLDAQTRIRVDQSIDELAVPRHGRGAEHISSTDGGLILNHASRGHIRLDLERYLFASAYAQAHGESPPLERFPNSLLPEHKNVQRALKVGIFTDRFRVQVAHRPATTVTSHISKDGHYYIHHDPTQCRSLTVREAARLQTFPDDYFFCGPRTSQYQQVGNAVPPLLAQRIATAVAKVLGE